MTIREYTEYSEEEIAGLYTDVGWKAYTDDLEALQKGYEHSLLCGFLTMITCGIAYPWASVPLLKWEYGGSVVSGDRAGYFGNGTDMFGIYIINGLLSFITCGIYYPWAICRMNRYIYSNVHIIRRG